MNETPNLHNRFTALKACVLIPTYNNGASLAAVINDVAARTRNIIVVNDGCTDNTEDILRTFDFLQVLTLPVNQGKGIALRRGFDFARQKGYCYAITMDSDGQHFAKDLEKFLDGVEKKPQSIIIGARNMNQETVPGKSNFGNKFSNFWFRIETGIVLPDTQSGYRLYPLEPLKGIRFITRRFEFEIEVLVRAAWKNIEVWAVPVSVYYAPKEIRVSHFRPFKDFARISALNTVLVLITALYIIPRNFLYGLFNRQKRRQLMA